MTFDMGRAWNEGVAKVSANFSLLAILGGVFFFLPSVLMFVALPDVMGMMMNPTMDPEDMAGMFGNLGPSFYGIYLLMLVASMVGYAAMIALMGDDRRLSVGEAIGVGFKALLPLFAIMVIFMIAYLFFAMLVGLVFGVLVALVGAASTTLAGILTFLLIVALMLAVVWVMTRFSMTMPVLAIEGTMNPFTALGRSWSLTAPVQGRLFLFYVLLFIAYMVIALVIFMIMGLIIAGIGAPSAIGFLNGIVGALVAMLFSGIVVAVYSQLAGTTAESLGDTFE